MPTSPRKRAGKSEYELGSFLKARRVENGWTREDAASKIGISERQLQGIENAPPSAFLLLQKILDFYGYKLVPKRMNLPVDKNTDVVNELLRLVETEFVNQNAPSKKAHLILAGRIIEMIRSLSKNTLKS